MGVAASQVEINSVTVLANGELNVDYELVYYDAGAAANI